MKANDDQCLTLVSLSRATYTDSHGQDASPLQVPSQQCWYSFAAETILRQIGVSEIAYASKANHAQCGDRTHDPIESRVQHPKH